MILHEGFCPTASPMWPNWTILYRLATLISLLIIRSKYIRHVTVIALQCGWSECACICWDLTSVWNMRAKFIYCTNIHVWFICIHVPDHTHLNVYCARPHPRECLLCQTTPTWMFIVSSSHVVWHTTLGNLALREALVHGCHLSRLI
jgi:hypothetical protein